MIATYKIEIFDKYLILINELIIECEFQLVIDLVFSNFQIATKFIFLIFYY